MDTIVLIFIGGGAESEKDIFANFELFGSSSVKGTYRGATVVGMKNRMAWESGSFLTSVT